MPIRMVCPNIKCGRIHEFPDEARGQVITCLRCDMQFRIPSAPKAPATRDKTADQLRLEQELCVAKGITGAIVL